MTAICVDYHCLLYL